jgi:phosphoribosylaminoimidazole carboxylase PurE protein
MSSPKVIIVMGSISDRDVMQEAANVLSELSIPFEMGVFSAHRTPERSAKLAKEAAERGVEAIIAGAGAAAHLAGAFAAHSRLPVIGVPIASTPLQGMDALLATVQMPAGFPVATMAIGKAGARNAAFFAAQILATKDAAVADKLTAWRATKAKEVEAASEKLASEFSGQ